MPQYNYAFQKFNKELMARAVGRDVAVSTKQSIEICNYLRHRKLIQAKRLLEGVIEQKLAVPFKRFTNGLGHRRGKMISGRYPVKASKAFLKLIESAEANAQTKGLNTSELEIVHLCAHKAHQPVHYGRQQGREFKRTHIEVVVQETTGKKKGKEAKKSKKEEGAKLQQAKVESKKEAPKQETPKKEVPKPVEKKAPVAENKPAETNPVEAKPKKDQATETKQEDKK